MSIPRIGMYDGVGHSSYRVSSAVVNVDWTKIPSRNGNLPSKDEITKLIKEKASNFENAASDIEKEEIWEEAQRLFAQYVSHGSPDRKALLKNSLRTIETQSRSENTTPNIDTTKTLIDILNEADSKRKGMKFDKSYPFEGGSVTAAASTVGTPYFSIAQDGKEVMSIGTRGNIGYVSTPTETALQREIVGMWYNTCSSVLMAGLTNESRSIDIIV